MLEVGRRRLKDAGVLDRCRLVQGHASDVADTDFDAAVNLLVAHFIKADERPAFYRAIHDRLKPGGCLLSAEISAALDAPEFPTMLENWKQVQRLMGASDESLAQLEGMLRTTLGVVSPADTEALWRGAGFPLAVPFFQTFIVQGWYALRPIEKDNSPELFSGGHSVHMSALSALKQTTVRR
ncbi:MAG: tRNA (cmo5U34)-methyltransferase [Afipia broomeae]|jgi:tRNA (cmo5U34)-methyltransferase|uniref:class I SAM-dependent methyltransferase n=1 Tax=Qipengyuania profunda TaxID=3113984 RepID=UPI002A18A539|nr:class I SAM-dependent methyltransferase [Qipengyuania sp. HL-TH1]WPL58458.1 class I SAM-dependent methyltransferase [Qipengyuania sp. HL-TH5]